MKHCYRERETPNADPEVSPHNIHLGAKTADQAMGRLRSLLPEKRRKDAVLAVEYVITASPEWWETATDHQQVEFFKKSLAWLKSKYGDKNLVTATVHQDEKTPHLSAIVAPITKDGRLSAKEFIGNKTAMTADQTSFANCVAELGLRRGLEGSKAKHQTVRKFYAQIQGPAPEPVSIDTGDLVPKVTKTGFLSKTEETPAEIAARISAKIAESSRPLIDAARGVQAALRDAAQARQKAAQERKARETEVTARKALEADTAVLRAALRGLTRDNRDELVKMLTTTSDQMRNNQARELEQAAAAAAAHTKAKREREAAEVLARIEKQTTAERQGERAAVAQIRANPQSSVADLRDADIVQVALDKLEPPQKVLRRSREPGQTER